MSLPFLYFSFSLFILPSLRTSHTCVKTEKLAIQTVVKLGNLRDFHNLDRKFIIFFFKHESHTGGYIYIYIQGKEKPVLDIDIASKFLFQILNCNRSPTSNWRRKLRQHLRFEEEKPALRIQWQERLNTKKENIPSQGLLHNSQPWLHQDHHQLHIEVLPHT